MSKASKSSGHFWPAYVDLMTVLLMVFMLLTLLFQMVASIARNEQGVKITAAETMDTDHSKDRPGMLKLRFEKEDAVLQDGDRTAIRSWLRTNASAIAKSGYVISASIPADRPDVGGGLSVQFSRILEVKRLAAEVGVSDERLTIQNQVADAGTDPVSTIRLYLGSP